MVGAMNSGRNILLAILTVICSDAYPANLDGGLADIKVGEKGSLTRIAIACEIECFVVQRGDGAFFITDIQADLSVDLRGRASNADSLTLSSATGGSVLTIAGRGIVKHSSIIDCVSNRRKGACIDLTFEEVSPRVSSQLADANLVEGKIVELDGASTQTKNRKNTAGSLSTSDLRGGSATRKESELGEQRDIPFLGAVMAPALATPKPEKFSPAPPLREETGREFFVIGKLAPPVRFAPPKSFEPAEAIVKKQKNVEKSILEGSKRIQARAPAITPRDRADVILAASFEIGEEAEKILGKIINTGSCAGARAKLQADAWALDAMVDRGICIGAEGKLGEAEASCLYTG